MQIPGRNVILTLALLLGAAPAGATASLTCSAEDRVVSIELVGNVGSGDGASVQITGGEIKLKPVKGKYFGPTEFKVEPGQVAGSWAFRKELRIGISPPDAGDVSAYLAIIGEMIKTKNDDITRWRGTYVLKLNGPKGKAELTGKLKGCDAG